MLDFDKSRGKMEDPAHALWPYHPFLRLIVVRTNIVVQMPSRSPARFTISATDTGKALLGEARNQANDIDNEAFRPLLNDPLVSWLQRRPAHGETSSSADHHVIKVAP